MWGIKKKNREDKGREKIQREKVLGWVYYVERKYLILINQLSQILLNISQCKIKYIFQEAPK